MLDAISGPWRRLAIYLLSLEGILLGPMPAALAAFIGSVAGRAVIGAGLISFVFGVTAEPVGALTAGFLVKGRWRPVIGIYGVMLASYFIHPYGRVLPLWAILDVVIALFLIYPASRIKQRVDEKFNAKTLSLLIVLVSFVSTVTDSLTRIFLLIPVGLYKIFFPSFDALYMAFVTGAIGSYVEDGLVCFVALIVITPVIILLRRAGIKFPLT